MIDPLAPGNHSVGIERLTDGRVRILKRDTETAGGPWVCLEVVDEKDVDAAIERAITLPAVTITLPPASPAFAGGLTPEVRQALRDAATGAIERQKPENERKDRERR